MPLAEAQGRLLAAYLLGEYRLPSRGRMHADIRRENAAMRKRYVASARHTIQVDFDRYLYELERERRRGAGRAARRASDVPGVPALAGGASRDRPVAA